MRLNHLQCVLLEHEDKFFLKNLISAIYKLNLKKPVNASQCQRVVRNKGSDVLHHLNHESVLNLYHKGPGVFHHLNHETALNLLQKKTSVTII